MSYDDEIDKIFGTPVVGSTAVPVDQVYVVDEAHLHRVDEYAQIIERFHRAYLDRLTLLKERGATAEQIVTYAINDRLRRFTRPSRPAPWDSTLWGATAADFGRAAVEALRHVGMMPNE